jgi:hypothetical protein
MARRLLIKLATGHAKGQSFLSKFSLFAKAETTPKVAAFVFCLFFSRFAGAL